MPGLHSALAQPCLLVEASQLLKSEVWKKMSYINMEAFDRDINIACWNEH